MTIDILRAYVLAARAQLDILERLAASLEREEAQGRATLVRPERCHDHTACALMDEDARIARGSFADPQAWKCRGCGHTESTIRA